MGGQGSSGAAAVAATSGKPRLLDLFCGAGGCAVGYAQAGFDVVGVDVKSQPRYPFKATRCDALIALGRLLDYGFLETHFGRVYLDELSAIHASPPCQRFTAYNRTGNVGAYLKTYGLRYIGCWLGHKPTRDDYGQRYFITCARCDSALEDGVTTTAALKRPGNWPVSVEAEAPEDSPPIPEVPCAHGREEGHGRHEESAAGRADSGSAEGHSDGSADAGADRKRVGEDRRQKAELAEPSQGAEGSSAGGPP